MCSKKTFNAFIMKKFIVLALIAIMSVSCYTSEDQKMLQQECKSLTFEKQQLQGQVSSLRDRVNSLNTQVHDLNLQKSSLETGREIKYIVKFKIKQGTFTLDIFEHAKNEMNAIEIEIPVNKDYYSKLSIGQDITDAFKWGSLVVNGDFSTLHMKVVGKRME